MARSARILIWAASILGTVVVAVAVSLWALDASDLKRYVTLSVRNATGRELIIEGDLQFDWGWISSVAASRIKFANASWSDDPHMFEVGRLEIDLDLWQLLRYWRVELPRVVISDAKLILEKNAEGAANWEFPAARAAADPVVPERRTRFPVIETLVIRESALLFTNRKTGTNFDLELAEAEASGFWNEPVSLEARGSYQDQPFRLSFLGGSYRDLRSEEAPYPVNIDLRAGSVQARIKGNLTEPLEMKGEDVTLEIQGEDMAELFPLIRVVFPPTPPYRLKGRLRHEGKVWSFSNFVGRVGDSDLSGDIRVDAAPERPFMKADLVSKLLDFDDLAGFIGGAPAAGPEETASPEQEKIAAERKGSERIFPDRPYNLERLSAMDAEVRLRAERILAPKLPIDNLDAKLTLSDGVLRFSPAAFGAANGRIELYTTFDASAPPARVEIDARIRDLDIKRLLSQSAFARKSLGPIGGRIALSGAGNSFRELMATASGNILLVMSGGQISSLLVELAGLDVAEALGVAVRGDKPVPIRCAVAHLEGKGGQMGVKTFVIDTTDTIVWGEGKIDLRDERFNLVLTPVPKDFSPLSLRSFIRVGGRFKNPSVFPDPLKTGTDSVLAKIFNALVTLLSTPLQPRDLGLGRDIDCEALIASVKGKDPYGVIPKAPARETKRDRS